MAAAAKVWNLDQMLRMLEKGTMTYSNIYQRSYVWDRETECNLIASFIEGRDIPAITANRHVGDDKKAGTLYDLLNGKQRMTASSLFIKDKFPLSNIRKLRLNPEDAIEFTDEEKEKVHYCVDKKGREIIDVNGLFFSELPEILQKVILGRMIRIEYHDNMSREDERIAIINANSGKGMTTAEKLRVEMASFEQVVELAKHPMFQTALTEKAIAGYWNEKLVEQIYCMLYMNEPALDIKSFRPFIRDAEFSDEQVEEISEVLDRFLEVFEIVHENDKIRNAKARILGKVHIVSFAKVMQRSINENVPVERMARWMEYFFSGKRRASISETYNEWSGRNTNQRKSIEKRLNEVNASYEKYITGNEEIPVVEKPAPVRRNKKNEEVIRTVVTDVPEPEDDMAAEDNTESTIIGNEEDFPQLNMEDDAASKTSKTEIVRTVMDDMNPPEPEDDAEVANEEEDLQDSSEPTHAETQEESETEEEETEEERLERELMEEKLMEEEFLKGLNGESNMIMLDDEDEDREVFVDPA